MRIKVTPTEKIDRLKENLKKRVESVAKEGEKLIVETEEPELLRKVPGIDYYESDGEKHDGLKGSPVDEQVYARLENPEDAVKAFLATVEGYDVRVLDSERQWDLKQLKKYNPDIKHLKFDEPKEFLGIEKTISEVEGVEKIEIEIPGKEQVKKIYREMLT